MIARPSRLLDRLTQRKAICNGFSDAIGNTPLLKLTHVSEETGCDILAKAEFVNPGGSVRDRAARAIIQDAERIGHLKPGGIIVDGTAGNIGIGLAHLCNARGYRCIMVMPDDQSPEKYLQLETLGAEVLQVKAVPHDDPHHYQTVARQLAEEFPDAFWANQFDNTASRDAFEQTIGPEIWRQTGGRIDAFVCATGTGGTLGGVSRFLKSVRPAVKIVLADPQGSSLYGWVRDGELKAHGPPSIVEGIGGSRVTANLKGSPIDDAVLIKDTESVARVYKLLREEGLFLGSTSGVNVEAAAQVARQLGPGHTVVTIVCDTGHKYQSRLFNRRWLVERDLLEAVSPPRLTARNAI